MKENAKEYLKEFADLQVEWLKALIYEVIETNGNISDDKKEEIYICLKDDTQIIISDLNINDNLDKRDSYNLLRAFKWGKCSKTKSNDKIS